MFKYFSITTAVIIIGLAGYFYFQPNNQKIFFDKENGYQYSYLVDTWQLASSKDLKKLNNDKKENDLKIQNALIHQDQITTTFGLIVQKATGAKTFNRDKSVEQMDKDNQNRHNS